jgi:hypothetical protein
MHKHTYEPGVITAEIRPSHTTLTARDCDLINNLVLLLGCEFYIIDLIV